MIRENIGIFSNEIPYDENNKNMLFDLLRINIEITFLNKNNNNFEYCENLKNLLNTQINKIKNPTSSNNILNYFPLKYIENDYSINQKQKENFFFDLNLNYKKNILLFFVLDENNNSEKYIKKYNENINFKNEENLTNRSILIFLHEEKEKINNNNNNSNIIFINKSIEINFIRELTIIITKLINNNYISYITERKKNMNVKFKGKFIPLILQDIGDLIRIQNFKQALTMLEKPLDDASNFDKAKLEEIKALILFYLSILDINNDKSLQFNKIIEDLYESSINKYLKNIKEKNCLYFIIDARIRLILYYSYFEDNFMEKIKKNLFKIQILLDDVNFEKESKFIYYLKISFLYEKLNLIRKHNFYYLLAYLLCFEDFNLNSMINFMTKNVCQQFAIYNCSKNLINNFEKFEKIHQLLIINLRKPISFYLKNNNNEKYELTLKKRFDKNTSIIVKRNFFLSKYSYKLIWNGIQKYIISLLISYYKTKNDLSKSIIFSLGYIQALYNNISIDEQRSILNFHLKTSSIFQSKLYLSMYKIPILIKIIPLSSDIKFDISQNPNKKKEENNNNDKQKIFLYNPWEINNSSNYYWTKNSYQNIKIQLNNPLNVEIEINKIRILFNGTQPLNLPTNIIISPKDTVFIISKIKPTKEGITNIIGIEYEIVNTIGIQYCDNNGNGLFFHYENISTDSLALLSGKKELINLHNIKIYPEIPLLNYEILDKNDVLGKTIELFDSQFYNFSFKLENKGKYEIDEIKCFIYVYKLNNYKKSLDDILIKTLIKPKENYVFNYKYLHKEIYKKIEFKIYYNSTSKNENEKFINDLLLKPYLFYNIGIGNKNLAEFSNQKIIPFIENSDSLKISKLDKRVKSNYKIFFSSEKNYISFCLFNSNLSKLKIEIDDQNNNNNKENNENLNDNNNDKINIIKEEIIEGNISKEISFIIDSNNNLDNLVLYWNFIDMDNVYGKRNFKQIFENIENKNKFYFEFNIETKLEKDSITETNYINCCYIIKNKSNQNFDNLKFIIYIYTIYENKDDINYVFNNNLDENIYIDGSLSIDIENLKSNEIFNYDIKIFPIENYILYSTCLIINSYNEEIYLSPINKNIEII